MGEKLKVEILPSESPDIQVQEDEYPDRITEPPVTEPPQTVPRIKVNKAKPKERKETKEEMEERKKEERFVKSVNKLIKIYHNKAIPKNQGLPFKKINNCPFEYKNNVKEDISDIEP